MGRLYCTVQFLSRQPYSAHTPLAVRFVADFEYITAAAANAQIEFLLFHLKQTLAVSIA